MATCKAAIRGNGQAATSDPIYREQPSWESQVPRREVVEALPKRPRKEGCEQLPKKKTGVQVGGNQQWNPRQGMR